MFSIYLQYTVIFTCFSEVIKMCSKVTSINCSSGLPLSEGWGASCPGWFILPPTPPHPPAQDLGQTVSSVDSYCIMILEYLVVRDVNIISVKLRCLHLTFSSVILVRGVGGKLSRFMSLSTKYSCSRWCNKICGLSILSEILGRGKINRPGQLVPHPLSIRNPTERLK